LSLLSSSSDKPGDFALMIRELAAPRQNHLSFPEELSEIKITLVKKTGTSVVSVK
jgi:hypothetical protein